MADRLQSGPSAVGPASLRRWLLAAAGVVAVGLGALGALVPGLPTTIFLILASYCFARSCPWLEERLLRLPLFSPYMRFIDEGRPMSTRARAVSLTAMWTSVLFSLVWLRASGRLSATLTAIVVAVAGGGTIAVLRFRRGARPEVAAARESSSA